MSFVERNVKHIDGIKIFESETSLINFKNILQTKIPDTVPIGKKIEIEVYIRIIDIIV